MIIEVDKVILNHTSNDPVFIRDPEVVSFFFQIDHMAKAEGVSCSEIFDEHNDEFDIHTESNGDKIFTFTFCDEMRDLVLAYRPSRGWWSIENLNSACFAILSFEEAAKLVVVHKLL